MPKNTKHKLQVARRDRAERKARAYAGLVDLAPKRTAAGSWWTQAPRDGFTAAARATRTPDDPAA